MRICPPASVCLLPTFIALGLGSGTVFWVRVWVTVRVSNSVYAVWCKNPRRPVIFSHFRDSKLSLLDYAFHRYPIRDVMRSTYPPVGNGIRDAQQRFSVTHSATSQCNPILAQTTIQLTLQIYHETH